MYYIVWKTLCGYIYKLFMNPDAKCAAMCVVTNQSAW